MIRHPIHTILTSLGLDIYIVWFAHSSDLILGVLLVERRDYEKFSKKIIKPFSKISKFNLIKANSMK